MFRGADKFLLNNNDDDAARAANKSGHERLGDVIKGFQSEDVG